MTSELQHFLSIPWCAKYLEDSNTEVLTRKPYKSGEDEFWSKTLNTPETLPFLLGFYPRPTPRNDGSDQAEIVRSAKAFVTVASGVQGFPGLVHGGVTMALLDWVAGLIPALNRLGGVFNPVPFVTAYLNTTFAQPAPMSSTLLLSADLVFWVGWLVYVAVFLLVVFL